jgi:hypothetical protein
VANEINTIKKSENKLIQTDTRVKKPLLKGKALSNILDAAVRIQMEPNPSEQDKAFLTRQLVQATLPHSDPGDLPAWQRKNGNLTLVIRPGWDSQKNAAVGYPYGSIPRLLLFWITTEALRTKSRKLELGASLAGFMRDLGLNPSTGGGKRGDGKRLRNQMERLFRASISLELANTNDNLVGKRWIDMQVAPEGELWWDLKSPDQAALFGSWIELGEKFYQAVTSTPVPLDRRVLSALKRSPLALDLYAWATYKNFSMRQQNRPEQFIPWVYFMKQFGAEYTSHHNFKKKVMMAFQKVFTVYRDLHINAADGGFIITQGATSVSYRPSKRN